MSLDISKTHLHWRVCRRDDKEYRSYSLARSFRENGKVRKEIVLKLGKLSSEEVYRWKSILKIAKGEQSATVSIEDIITEANDAYLDVAVLLETWHHWGLSSVFKNISDRHVPLWMVVAILTINRCVDPSSKSQVSAWFRSTALPHILGVKASQMNSSRIFRELSVIDELKSDLCNFLYKEVANRDPASIKSVFYDLSSTTFSGTRCVLMDWGHCKEGFENHIVLALVVNKVGLPIYWEVLPGCTADVSTIEFLIANLKGRFHVKTSTMVFDRGMVSFDNLNLLEKENIKYISAMDRNQLTKFSDVKFVLFSGATAAEVEKAVYASNLFQKLNETTYYHEVKFKNNAKMRYILCFNPQLCDDQRKARLKAIETLKSKVKIINGELLDAKISREEKSTQNKFVQAMSIEQKGYVKISLNQHEIMKKNNKNIKKTVFTYQGTLKVDDKKLLDAGQLDGFWMIVTNHIDMTDNAFSLTAAEVIRPYQEKVVIESAFRDIKSFLEIKPIHVWTEEHVRAHYTICVLSYLLNRTLTLRLHDRAGNCSKDVVAHEKLYAELEKCLVNHTKIDGTNIETVGLTRPTERQIELLERIGFSRLLEKDLVKKYYMKTGDVVYTPV